MPLSPEGSEFFNVAKKILGGFAAQAIDLLGRHIVFS
jgi:hypothetical protein